MTETGPYLTLREAAAKLRKSERWLWDWLDKHPRDRFDRPYYHLAGRTKLLSEGDLARIFEDLPCPSVSARPAKAKRRTTKSGANTLDSELRVAAELLDDPSLLNISSGSKPASKSTASTPRPKLNLIQGSRPS